jgi:hypothetical protein
LWKLEEIYPNDDMFKSFRNFINEQY